MDLVQQHQPRSSSSLGRRKRKEVAVFIKVLLDYLHRSEPALIQRVKDVSESPGLLFVYPRPPPENSHNLFLRSWSIVYKRTEEAIWPTAISPWPLGLILKKLLGIGTGLAPS